MVVDSYEWLWVVFWIVVGGLFGGFGWLWVVVGNCGWLWMVMGGCGWL